MTKFKDVRTYSPEELERVQILQNMDKHLLADSDRAFLNEYFVNEHQRKINEQVETLSKVEAEQKIAKTFWGLAYDETGSMWVARLVLIPYQCLVWFIKFLWFLLIPYQSIKNYTKEIFPIAFSLGIIVLMLFNGVYISVSNIDGLLFENTFIPFMWWFINLILIAILVWTTFVTIKNVQSDRIAEDFKVKQFDITSMKDWVWIVLFPLVLVGIPIIFTWSNSYMNWKLFQISSSSLFGYAAYLTYLFITTISLYNIFKRSIYFIFATLDREFPVMRKQLMEIGISLLLVLVLNGFLTINFLMF